jgi:hypothetical protein
MKRLFAVGVVILGSAFGCGEKNETAAPAASTQATPSAGDVAIKDPAGFYKLFSDASITKPPESNLVFGNGQTFTIEYDGSKSKEGDSVFYQITYVDPEGSVRPITGGSFDGVTRGTFSTDKKVYESAADGRPGFMEVSVVQNAKVVGGDQGVTGQNVRLGVYPITIESSK